MSDMGKTAAAEFQQVVDSLFGQWGLSLQVKFLADGHLLGFFLAGVRVLDATPIFDRRTGAVASWRYWMLFAEMGMLDPLNAGHPLHVFQVRVLERKGHFCVLRAVDGEFDFTLSTNDPHEVFPDQGRIYEGWAARVEQVGGQARLDEILDQEAAHARLDIARMRGPDA